MSFRINNGYIQQLHEPGQVTDRNAKSQNTQNRPGLFQDILNQQVEKANRGIKVSGHASMRLMERNITLNDHDLKVLSEAMDKASEKGAKESLMLYKDIAFIASIRNRTLITAVDPQGSKENIFTNIDSAVIVK